MEDQIPTVDTPASTPPARVDSPAGSQALRLFAFSFAALFLELTIIRWSPSEVRLIAYYANLMLISSFLGLGVGAMLSNSKRRLLDFFPSLLLLQVAILIAGSLATLPGSNQEARFYLIANRKILDYLLLVSIFVSNAALFVPLGQQIGILFQTQPPLKAYTWDLGGSLCGTIFFGLFSFTHFSPILGMLIVSALFILVTPWRSWRLSIPVFAAVLLAMHATENKAAIWSPYYFVTMYEHGKPAGTPGVTEPPPGLRTMRNPPIYDAKVNQDFYQPHQTLDPSRYDEPERSKVAAILQRYTFPYQLALGRDRVVVVGAGGGCDVEAALISGVKHVDAVEIDPVLVSLSRKFNAADVYGDPRVHIQVDDGRAFLRRAKPGYDLVVFGYLDSQALFSHMSNIRLDGYIYTVEDMRQAYSLLAPNGVLSLSFAAGQEWLGRKIVGMVREGTGKMPYPYIGPNGNLILLVPKGEMATTPPPGFNDFKLAPTENLVFDIDLPTDDWPYLYLTKRTIPSDYLIVIGVLLVISLVSVFAIRGRKFDTNDGHFLFMGVGFLLLETKSIGDCSLYFGSTWLVTMLVIAGVLLMVLGANLVAIGIPRFSPYYYLPLMVILAILYMVPVDEILALPLSLRAAWTVLAVPLPIFFAGLIFSLTFREGGNPALLFGANLVGAMLGGFAEYMGMAIGNRALTVVVVMAYAASLLCRLRIAKQVVPAVVNAPA